ncbi:MAG: ATPase domain-containing protein [Methanomassiliicoccales archaeon]
MSKRFECPRCGAGVHPTDTQCPRCGSPLNESEDVQEDVPSITLENILDDRKTSVRTEEEMSTSGLRQLLERKERELQRKEEDLRSREEEVLSSAEQIEGDTMQLESEWEALEREKASLSEKEEALRERERKLEDLSGDLEEWRETLARLREKLGREGLTPADLQRLLKIQDHFRSMVDMERGKVLGEIGSDEARPEVKEELPPDKVREIFQEIDQQLGKGLEGDPEWGLVPTHIERLDTMLGGGIPRGSVALLSGPAGAMKSSLAFHVLHHAAVERGIGGIYLSLEQRKGSLLRQMERMGMDHSLSEGTLRLVDMEELRGETSGREGDWRTVLQEYVQENLEETDLFVLDSLESFKALTEHWFGREELAELFAWLRSMGLTVLLISELPERELLKSREGEMYLADGVIELSMRQVDDTQVKRRLRVVKMRGMNHDSCSYTLKREGSTFQLHAPLVGSTGPFS